MNRTPTSSALLATAILTLTACGDPNAEREALLQTLRSCGLLSEGELGQFPVYAPDSCYAACFAEANCADLEGALCRSDIGLLLRCDERCAHRCADDTLVHVDSVCDGIEDCEGGDDEAGCGVYECEDGTRLTGEHRCDGRYGCWDLSDERDCPLRCDERWQPGCPFYACEDGEEIRADFRCDGWPQCDDESDEVGCAMITTMCSP